MSVQTLIEPYVMTLPAVPPSFNEYTRWHWAKQAKKREEFQEQVWAKLNEAGNRCPRGFDEAELHSVLMFTTKRRRDSDNFGAVLYKWTQDVLVQQRVIPDDTSDRCTSYPPEIVLGDVEQTVLMIHLRVRER